MNECQDYKGRAWCATAVNGDKTYKTFGWCLKDKCKEEKKEEEKSLPSCIACIVQFAPVCIPKCLPKPFNTACSQCVLQNGIECAGTCGKEIQIMLPTIPMYIPSLYKHETY